MKSIVLMLAGLLMIAMIGSGCTAGLQSPVMSLGHVVSYESGSSDLEIVADGNSTLDVVANVDALAKAGDGKLGITANGAKRVTDKGTHANLNQIGGKSVEATFRGGYSKEGTGDNATADHFSESSVSVGGGTFYDLIRGRGIDANRANVPALPMREKRKEISPPAAVPAD